MNILTLILAAVVMNFTPQEDPHSFWERVLKTYEQLCDACLEHKPTKEINGLTKDLNEMLKHPVGKMDSAQQERFVRIQNRYKGIISINTISREEQPARLVKVDTVRRVEHVKVVDTVFVKELIGAIEIDQKITNRDTVVHIIQYQPIETVKSSEPAAREDPQPTPVPPLGPDPSTQPESNRINYFVTGNVGVIPDLSYGAMFGAVDRWGFYANFRFRNSSASPAYDCTPEGVTPSGNIWTNGVADYSRLTCSAGGGYDFGERLFIYAGAGYGSYNLFWQDIDGRWAKISDVSCQGVNIDAGILLHIGHIAITAESCWTAFKYWDMSLGLGFWF